MSLTPNRTCLVPPASYPPTLGAIVSMMENSRASLLDAAKDLSPEQLSAQFDAKSNPIGSLLGHIAAVEWVYCTLSAENRQPTGDEWAKWGALLRLTPTTWDATRGQPLEQHMERLHGVRTATLAALSIRSDEWLHEPIKLMWMPETSNHLWVWYHVIEDELNHRGQIRWLRQRL